MLLHSRPLRIDNFTRGGQFHAAVRQPHVRRQPGFAARQNDPFLGLGTPGKTVRVELGGRTAMAVTKPDGRWQTEIKAPAPGGPYTVNISDADQTVTLHEVLVGDVWLCGGQSNLEIGLARARNGADEIKAANHPLFTIKQHAAYAPAATVQGNWLICSPQTVTENGWNGFYAVAYFFGRKL